MKTPIKAASLGLLAITTLAFHPSTGHAAMVLNFDSANYNAGTGVWADTSGNANNAFQLSTPNRPTLTLNATPSGHSAVTFTQAQLQYLDLTAHLNGAAFTSAPSFTLLAVARHPGTNGEYLLSGNAGAGFTGTEGIAFVLDGNNRSILAKNNIVAIGSSTSATDHTNFHLFGVTYDGTTARYFLDGVADGTAVNSQTFFTGIFDIGVQAGTGAGGFIGDMAAIQVYDTALSGAALANAQNALLTTTAPEPASAALLGLGTLLLAARRRRSAQA